MKRIILITGGQRSGKSSFAEKKAHELTTSPVYLATARIWDEEFRKRVERHQKNRGPEWTNIEEEKELSRHNVAGRVVVIDCVTLWCTNFFMEFDSNVASSLEAVKKEFDKFTQQDATFIFVTNEIGWGGEFPRTNCNVNSQTCKVGPINISHRMPTMYISWQVVFP